MRGVAACECAILPIVEIAPSLSTLAVVSSPLEQSEVVVTGEELHGPTDIVVIMKEKLRFSNFLL